MSKALCKPVFIIGTGRCGSTLLSNMLRQNSHILSLSELFSFISDFGSRIDKVFPTRPISGEQFWRLLAECLPKQNLLLKNGLQMEEVIYPFAKSSRFSVDTGVPAILQAALPHLSDTPDALFDELAAVVVGFPLQGVSNHYRQLAEWLARREQKRCWVERSGGSLRSVPRLIEHFPDAKFLHIARDGRDCSLSMSKHIGFRMALIVFQQIEFLGLDPFESDDRSEIDDLPEELIDLLPENFSQQAFINHDLPPSLCGYYWSGEIRDGLAALANLPGDQVMHMRYEDFLQQPQDSVQKLGQFILPEAVSDLWCDVAAKMVRVNQPKWQNLPEAERRELIDNCQLGFDELANVGLHWPA